MQQTSMNEYFHSKYGELPRPESWMPGPPAPWSYVAVDERRLTSHRVKQHLADQHERQSQLASLNGDTANCAAGVIWSAKRFSNAVSQGASIVARAGCVSRFPIRMRGFSMAWKETNAKHAVRAREATIFNA